MTLTGTFGVFMSVDWPVWLMVLIGCGAVCDITGAPVLFIPVFGGGAFVELCPFLASVSLHVLVFPASSATAVRITLLTALELHLLTGPEDAREATVHGWPFLSPSDLCFVDLSVG